MPAEAGHVIVQHPHGHRDPVGLGPDRQDERNHAREHQQPELAVAPILDGLCRRFAQVVAPRPSPPAAKRDDDSDQREAHHDEAQEVHVLPVALGADARHPVIQVAAGRGGEQVGRLQAPRGHGGSFEARLALEPQVPDRERSDEHAREPRSDRQRPPQAGFEAMSLGHEVADHDGGCAHGEQQPVVLRAQRERRGHDATRDRAPRRRHVEHPEEQEKAQGEQAQRLQLGVPPMSERKPAEREGERCEHGRVISAGEPLREEIGRDLRTHHQQQDHEVERGDRTAGHEYQQPVERRSGQHQVGVRQRQRAGPEDGSVEQVQRVRDQRVDVPRHDPRDQRRVAGVRRQGVEDAVGSWRSHDDHGEHEDRAEDDRLEPSRSLRRRRHGRRHDVDALLDLWSRDAHLGRREETLEYLTMQYSARTPSFQPIFLPSAYVRPS